jgi:eukaryotic-like serine/threonine-protein kinase
MALQTGSRIASYEIIGPIGAGGMGEVYRARDTQLHRDVAIKALPDPFAQDRDRVARFEREAQVLAALNHPHIAAIYGLEDSPAGKFLVLEFIDGQSLEAHLGTGAMSLQDALPVVRQIVDAFEAAHDKGIVHRDLKPSNIMLTVDGDVKVLDFGLARIVDVDPASNPTNSPTLTFGGTQAGLILGTAAYMAPEQAKGRTADKRSDVWSFGCVLFEMLSGRRAFDGEDVSDTLAAVLRGAPDWSALPGDLPDGIRLLLKRCLVRDRKVRIPEMAVVRFLLEDAVAPRTMPAATVTAEAAPRRLWLWTAGALALGIGMTSFAAWGIARWTAPASPAPVRFTIATAGLPLRFTPSSRPFAISPDGRRLAYISGDPSRTSGRLVLRELDRLDAEPLAGITDARWPFFSPDGKWIAYVSGSELKKVSVNGGAPSTICTTGSGPGALGASWGADDTVVFGGISAGLKRVPAAGGEPKEVTTRAPAEVFHGFPAFLPDGRHVLYTVRTAPLDDTIRVIDLKTGQQKTVIAGRDAQYVDGFIVYGTGVGLQAVQFDMDRLATRGEPFTVAGAMVLATSGTTAYSISASGTLVYISSASVSAGTVGSLGGGSVRSLVWVDRQGHEEPTNLPARPYFDLRLSPDDTRVALDVRDVNTDIWTADLDRQLLTRATTDPAVDMFPIWTLDGRRLIFSSTRRGNPTIFQQEADGTGQAEQLTNAPYPQFATSVSPDGTRLLINEVRPSTGADISVLTLDGKSQPVPLLQTSATERIADFSPDGKWFAYESDESGASEIYARPFPDANSRRVQISTAGGTKPLWARSGREIFYIDTESYLTSVPVTPGMELRPGRPVRLFKAENISSLVSMRFYDATRDGQRFVVIKESSPAAGSPSVPPALDFTVVLNTPSVLKAAVGK